MFHASVLGTSRGPRSCLSGHHLYFPFKPMMDRNKAAELPKLQVGFIDFVCTFVYKVGVWGSCTRRAVGAPEVQDLLGLSPSSSECVHM